MVFSFQMHQRTLLEPPENMGKLLGLHYGGLEALTCLISVKCRSLKAKERKKDYCCYGDGRAVQAAWLYFPLLRLIIWNNIKMGRFVVFLWMWNCGSPGFLNPKLWIFQISIIMFHYQCCCKWLNLMYCWIVFSTSVKLIVAKLMVNWWKVVYWLTIRPRLAVDADWTAVASRNA